MADAFMEVDGVKGDSTDKDHPDQIEILSFNHGASQQIAGARSAGGAGTSGRCHHEDFVITKQMDKASAPLMLLVSNGKHVKKVTIDLCRASGDKRISFMKYILSDVIFSSGSVGGTGGADSTEQYSLNYGKIEWEFTTTDAKGEKKGTVKHHWDLEKNEGK